MRRNLALKRISPALVVSIIALFVALGGTGYAATKLSSRSQASAAKCGTKCQEIKLIKSLFPKASVAKAKYATTAGTAKRATSAASVDNIKTWFVKASMGQTVTLFTAGPFTYTGQCSNVSGKPEAQTFVATSQDGSVSDSYAQSQGTHIPFNVATGAIPIGYTSNYHVSTATAGPHWAGPYDGSDTQFSGDGHTYVNTFTSVGTNLQSADCVFTGYAFVRTQ